MDSQKTPVLKKIPSWLRSFRISKDASVPQNKEVRLTSRQPKGFLRSYRRSLGSKKNEESDAEGNNGAQDFARGSLMSIRKIWAQEAKDQAWGERSKSERRPKKSYALRATLLESPSKIPISEKMQAHQRELQLSFYNCNMSSNKENMAPVSASKCKSNGNCSSAGSSDGNLASEIVLSAARHAKNRRSLVKEHDVWKTAVNNVGLPRTSTELEQLPKVGKEQDLPTLSPVVRAARNEKDRTQEWAMHNSGCRSGLPARYTLPCVQKNQLPHCEFLEETIPKYVDCAPKIPPRTYLAKLAHAKAHLAKTVAPFSHVKASTTTPNIRKAKCGLSGHGHSLCKNVEHGFLLPSNKTVIKQRISGERHKGMYEEVVRSRETSSQSPQPRKAVRPQVQHNPSYGIGCSSRIQNLKKNCRTSGSGVMADDEATVLNCSCDRCLDKFSVAEKHVPGRTADHHCNCHRGSKHQTANSCFSKYGKHASAVSRHCTCCKFKKTCARLKVVADASGESLAFAEASRDKTLEKRAKCSTSTKHAFHCKDEITRVIEEAVKASIEKLLANNSIPQLSKSRSAESLHEPTQFKRASSSPLKYIPLSSCYSGTAEALLNSTDGATVDSGIALVRQLCPAGGTVNDISDDDDIFKTCSQSSHLENGLERSTSLPSLVESSSPAKLKVSTAFIKLVKRVSSGQGNDKISSQHTSSLDGKENRGGLTPRESCSECSSSGTEESWQPAESHCTDDLCIGPEKTSNQMAQSRANTSKLPSGAHCQLESSISHSEPQPSPGLDESRSSLTSVPGRMSPDGWERTPPCDVPVRADLDDDELSELNPRMSEDMQENCFSTDSDGSDDQHILEEVIRKGMGVTPPVKLPSRCPKLMKTPRKFKPAEMFSGKAKLKLSAYVNSGHVTVHVIRAAKLVTSRGGSANAYIKVSLQPDHIKRAHWRTAVMKSSRNPEFDHKFSFELMADDTGKRLLVTVWHRDFENKRSELLGSMSFGMGKILNSDQYVKGWYRLLRQDLGMHRHFAARCSRGSFTRVKPCLSG